MMICKKQKIVISLWCFFLIFIWFVWFSPTIQSDFIYLMDMLCFYLPICIVFTISFFVYLVAVLRNAKKSEKALLPKGIKVFLCITVVFCSLFILMAHNVLYAATVDNEQNFQQVFSLKNLIGENYNENDLYTKENKNWGDTFFIHGIVLVNTEKLICADEKTRNLYPNPIVNYDVQYIQNVPNILHNHMTEWLHSRMKMFIQNCAFADSSQIKSFKYEDVQFQIYYDKYQDFKTERFILCAEYKNDMLLFGLILEDETEQLSLNQDYILENIIEFLGT